MGRRLGSRNKKKNPNDARGGARVGAGRKPKADEIKLIERLDNIIDQDAVLEELKKQAIGYEIVKINKEGKEYSITVPGDLKAIQIYMQYRFGKPRETKDLNINTEMPIFNLDEE